MIVQTIIILSFQLSHFKIPRYIEFVDEFPTTVTGKIQKFVMRSFLFYLSDKNKNNKK